MRKDTREALFNATINELAKNGISGLKLSEIAKNVGIKTPSIYAFFNSKEDLISYTLKKCEESVKKNAFECDINKKLDELLLSIFIHYIKEFSKEPLLSYYIFLAKEALTNKEIYQKFNALLYSVEVQISFLVNEKLTHDSKNEDITDMISSVIIASFPSIMLTMINEGEDAAIYEAEDVISFASLL